MKIFTNVILTILILLAISSGVTKILLMQQDVEFFSKYGFTNSILITYGAIQLLGGILLVFTKTRIAGAVLVAITFLISLVLLVMEGNIPVAIFTFLCVALLVFVTRHTSTRKNIQTSASST